MAIVEPSTAAYTRTPSNPIRWAGFATWLPTTAIVIVLLVRGGVPEGAAPSWLLVATALVSFVAPDLTFLVGAGQHAPKGRLPRPAVPYYNAMHVLWGPLVVLALAGLAAVVSAIAGSVLLVAALSWAAHVLLDRAAGYGLRRRDGGR